MGAAGPAPAVRLRIVSGGQTGADRAALDFALARGWPHGGWCPHGRRTETDPLEARYQLRETPSADYRQRTEWNVRDSDGTVIFSLAPRLTGGSATTAECTRRLGKPWLHRNFRKTVSPLSIVCWCKLQISLQSTIKS